MQKYVMLDTASAAIAASFGIMKKGFKGLVAPRGVVDTGADSHLKADLKEASRGKVLSRRVIRCELRRQAKLHRRAGNLHARALKRFPDVTFEDASKPTAGDRARQSKVLAKRKGFVDMLMASGAEKQALKAALGIF